MFIYIVLCILTHCSGYRGFRVNHKTKKRRTVSAFHQSVIDSFKDTSAMLRPSWEYALTLYRILLHGMMRMIKYFSLMAYPTAEFSFSTLSGKQRLTVLVCVSPVSPVFSCSSPASTSSLWAEEVLMSLCGGMRG